MYIGCVCGFIFGSNRDTLAWESTSQICAAQDVTLGCLHESFLSILEVPLGLSVCVHILHGLMCFCMERDVEVGFSSGDINRKTPPSSRLDGYREEEPDSILGVPGVVRSVWRFFVGFIVPSQFVTEPSVELLAVCNVKQAATVVIA